MHRCEPIHHHIEQVVRDEEGKDIRQEIVSEGFEGGSWCLDENEIHAPVNRCGNRTGGI